MQITVGKVSDDFEKLKTLCREEADKLIKEFVDQEIKEIEIPFWTEDYPELICVAKFTRNDNKELVYHLDFSQTTL